MQRSLVIMLVVIWGSAYRVIEQEKDTHVIEATSRAQRLVDYFASNVSANFQYADDYAKAMRRIYLKTHAKRRLQADIQADRRSWNALNSGMKKPHARKLAAYQYPETSA